MHIRTPLTALLGAAALAMSFSTACSEPNVAGTGSATGAAMGTAAATAAATPMATPMAATPMMRTAAAMPMPGARPVPPKGPDPRGGVFTMADATEGLPAGETLTATIETSKGTINCTLWPHLAPNTVANFVGLARGVREWADPATGDWVKKPYFDGTAFHRIIPGFMVQFGDPYTMGWGAGKPGYERPGTGNPGYKFDDEIHAENMFNRAGLLAMANAGVRDGKGTNGSQMFITINPDLTRLNPKHTIFGECAEHDVVNAIAMTPRHMMGMVRDRPIEPVSVTKVTINRM